jgi:hypothetical protein
MYFDAWRGACCGRVIAFRAQRIRSCWRNAAHSERVIFVCSGDDTFAALERAIAASAAGEQFTGD